MNELTRWKQTAIAEQVPPDDNTHLLLQGRSPGAPMQGIKPLLRRCGRARRIPIDHFDDPALVTITP